MNAEISKGRQQQIAAAYRAGKTAGTKANPYNDRDGMMPESLASVQCALWHAFAAGREGAAGNRKNAFTMIRNARFCMRRATALGRA